MNIIQRKSKVEIFIELLFALLLQTNIAQSRNAIPVVEQLLQISQNFGRLLVVHEYMVCKGFAHAVCAKPVRQPKIVLCLPQNASKGMTVNAAIARALRLEQIGIIGIVRERCEQRTIGVDRHRVECDHADLSGLLLFDTCLICRRLEIADPQAGKIGPAKSDRAADQEHKFIARLAAVSKILSNANDILFITNGIHRTIGADFFAFLSVGSRSGCPA